MKTLEFSKKSWHYLIATKLGPLHEHHEVTDFCRYVRAVIFGSLWGLCILIVGAVVLYALGDFLGWLVVSAINWQFVQPSLAVQIILMLLACVGIIAGAAVLVFGLYFGVKISREHLHERAYQKRYGDGSKEYVPPPPGFIESAWKTFKDKTCFRVELK